LIFSAFLRARFSRRENSPSDCFLILLIYRHRYNRCTKNFLSAVALAAIVINWL
jgi:hypothetical protein